MSSVPDDGDVIGAGPFLVVWEYQVNPEQLSTFERVYSSSGAWAALFNRTAGYQGTELLRDVNDPFHYMTIDRWASSQDYETFLMQWRREYAALDAECNGLTVSESLVGKWDLLSPQTR
jgi:heme-degrading monooxygenase HmoA